MLRQSRRALLLLLIGTALFLGLWTRRSQTWVQQIRQVEDRIDLHGRFARHRFQTSPLLNPPGQLGRWMLSLLQYTVPGVLQRIDAKNHYYNIEVTDEEADDAFLLSLNALPRIQNLHINRGRITDAGLSWLSGRSDLRALKLINVDVSDAGLAHIAGLRSLQSLRISDTDVTADGLAHLGRLHNLSQLHLWLRGDIGAELDIVQELDKLKHLTVSGPEFTGRHLDCLNRLPQLTALSFEKSRVSDESLAQLAGLKSLKQINLSGTAVTDKVVDTLASMPSLESIDLSRTEIGDDALHRLAEHFERGRFQKLTILYLNECSGISQGMGSISTMTRLRVLELAGSDVTNDDLRFLPSLPELVILDLSRTNVGDRGITEVAKISTLQRCFLEGTPITVTGLNLLGASFSERLDKELMYINIGENPFLTTDDESRFRVKHLYIRHWRR